MLCSLVTNSFHEHISGDDARDIVRQAILLGCKLGIWTAVAVAQDLNVRNAAGEEVSPSITLLFFCSSSVSNNVAVIHEGRAFCSTALAGRGRERKMLEMVSLLVYIARMSALSHRELFGQDVNLSCFKSFFSPLVFRQDRPTSQAYQRSTCRGHDPKRGKTSGPNKPSALVIFLRKAQRIHASMDDMAILDPLGHSNMTSYKSRYAAEVDDWAKHRTFTSWSEMYLAFLQERAATSSEYSITCPIQY